MKKFGFIVGVVFALSALIFPASVSASIDGIEATPFEIVNFDTAIVRKASGDVTPGTTVEIEGRESWRNQPGEMLVACHLWSEGCLPDPVNAETKPLKTASSNKGDVLRANLMLVSKASTGVSPILFRQSS